MQLALFPVEECVDGREYKERKERSKEHTPYDDPTDLLPAFGSRTGGNGEG